MVEQLVFSGHTGHHPVRVSDAGTLRTLRFGTEERQSCIDLRNPHILQLAYTRWMSTALLLPPRLDKFLVLGLGGGALPHFLLHHHPQSSIDVVEKERLVIEVAYGYFRLPLHPGVRMIPQDALSFLRTPSSCGYDVAFLDIFGPGTMAPALFDPELYRRLLERLHPEGVLAINLWSGDNPLYQQAMEAAYRASDGRLVQMQVKRRSNVIVLLFPEEIPHRAIKKARKHSVEHQQRYDLDFPQYLKRLCRANRFSLLASLLR